MDTAQLERVYRAEAPRITAALAARIGDVGLAADAVQDAFVEAIEHWRDGHVPPNPGGWLATTARRKAIDRLRRARAGQEKLALLAATTTESWDGGQDADDELLGMVFACCHPALPRESQIALTLRAVCGLTNQEIATAFNLILDRLEDIALAKPLPDPPHLSSLNFLTLKELPIRFSECRASPPGSS